MTVLLLSLVPGIVVGYNADKVDSVGNVTSADFTDQFIDVAVDSIAESDFSSLGDFIIIILFLALIYFFFKLIGRRLK